MKLLTMDLLHGFQANAVKCEHVMNDPMVVGHDMSKTPILLITRLPISDGIKLLVKTILLALIIAALPSLGSAIRELPSDIHIAKPEIKGASPTNQEALCLLFHEMSNEGHLKVGDRVLVITGDNDRNIYDSHTLGKNNEIEFVTDSDMKRQRSLPSKYFDFIFTQDLSKDRKLIDRTLKEGGIATYKYNGKYHLGKIRNLSNYHVVYLRQQEFITIVTLQKLNSDTKTNVNLPTKRRLLGVSTTDEKKEVLENLEDVLLEPPRATRSRSYLKRTRYLPDLLGDSFNSYKRRVFIDVGPPDKTESSGDLSWFGKHYPTRNKDFEIYRIDTVGEVSSGDEVAQVGMSDWLSKNVREEEYVVIKAEAEVVEEMVKNKALALVDELFLECKYQGVKEQSKRSRRAYWECLALYGRLRDEGIAVHQWWG